MVFLENVAPLVNSLNLGIVSPFLLGLPPLQCAQIKTQLALHQFNSVAPNYPIAASPWLNEAFLNVAMFNPRGSMPPRPRGPSMPDPIPRGPFHGPGAGPGGLQRQLPPNADGMPQRFMGSEMRAGFPRPNIQGPPLRMDPRQTAKRLNMEQQQQPPLQQQQKMEGCGAHWDNPFPPGNNSQNQPPPGRMADYPPPVQSRYTNESASSILASFGLSNEDLEELSRYPDDQLTPENMPIILRDIRMRKMAPPLASLPPQSSEKENFRSDDGRGPMIKGKVIDYGHESKYGYDEGPLDVKVYGSDGPSKDSLKAFQSQPTPPAGITSKQMNAVEELIRQMGFQRSAPNTQSFFSMDASNKMSGMCLPSTGTGVAPAVQPIMPPVGPPPLPQPGIPPVRQALPPPSVARPMMPAMNQPPPPPFVPEMLGGMNRRDRIHEEARPRPSAPPGPAPPPAEKPFRKEIDGPIKSPFGVVKASWLPVFSKTDAQKMKRLPTPSMMNDYYAASPRIFPHMCSLCNVECRHLKDWLQHQNSSTHLESCRQLRQQYPDWNPESHSSSKRQEGDRNENSGVRRRSASISPRRSRRSSSGHARRRTRSRSRSPRHRPGRQRSRSPRPPPNFRHRSRSPWRPYNPTPSFRRSSSRERGSRRYIRSPDKALEAVMKCLGPRIVEQIHKQAFSQGFSGGRRASADFEEGKTGSPAVSSKPQKREGHSRHSSSEAKTKAAEAAECPNKEEMAAEGKPKKPPSETPVKEADAPASKFWSKPRSLGTILQISDLPEDGFTDQDIKKIVQPFGKVSDILVDRCKHEAYLEMNYKEAVIAAVKFNETSPVLINGKRVKISVAEKPKAAATQSKGNEKKVTQNVKDPALNNKKEQIASVVKKIAPLSSASKADAKKPGKVVKSGESKATVKPKKTMEAKKTTEAKKMTEAKKPGVAAVKQNDAAEAVPSEEGKNPPKAKKMAESAKPVDSKVKEPLKTKKLVEPKEKEAGPKGKKMGESKAKEPLKAKKGMDPKAKDLPPKAKKAPENKKAGEPPKAKKAAEPKKAGDSKDAKEPLKVKKVAESKESAKEPNAGESSQAGESQAKEPSKPAEAPDKSEAVESPEAVESGVKDPEEMCVVMISSFPEARLSLEEIRNLTKPFGKVKDILIVSSHKKAYVEISRKSADSMVKFYTCFPMWVERNQLCISLVPELKDLNEEIIFTTMIKDANPDVNTETLYTQFVHLGNLPDGGYSELEILCVGLRFGRVDHYMVITNKNKAVLQLNSAESAASMCRFLKRYPYSLGEVQLTISRSPRIEPAAADAVRKEVKNQDASQESPDLKAIPEGSGVVHPSAVPPTEATEDRGSDSEAFPETETQHLGSQKMVGEVASEPLKTEDSEEDSKALKEDFGLRTPSTGEDFESSEKQSEEACTLSSTVKKEEQGTDDSEQELPRKASPSDGEKANEEVAPPPPGKAGEAHSASKEETARALSASATEEGTSADLGPGPTQAALEEMPSTDTLSADRPTSPAADHSEASVGLAETPAPRLQVKTEDESEGPSAASQAKVEVAAEPAGVETKENLKEKFQLQLARVEVTLEKLPENLVLKAEEAKLGKTPEESAKVQNPEHVVPKTPQGKGPGQAQAEESCKASTSEAETVANPEAASFSKTVLKASNPPKASRLSARRKEEKPAGKPVAKSQGPAEKTPSLKQPSQPRPANGRSGVPDSAKSKLSMSSVVVVALGTGKSSSQQDKDPPAETKGSPKQSREPESRPSNLKRDAGGNKVSAGRNTRASKSSPKPKEEEELFPFNLDEFVTMDEVVDEVESPQPRRNPARGKRKDPPKKNLPCEPSSKRKKAKATPETEVSFVTLDEIGEDEGGMGQAELLSLEAMTDAQGLVTVDEVNEEEELIDDMKDPQSLVTLDEISEQEDVAPPEMAKEPFASEESEPDLKTEPLLTVDEIGEVEELPLNELSHFKDEEMLKGKEEGKAGVEHAGDFLSSQIPDDPSILVTVDEIHEDSDDQPLMTLDEVTEEDEDFLEDFNRLKEEFTFVTVDEVGSEEEEEEEKPGLSTDRKWKEVTKTAAEEEEKGAERDVPFSAELENVKIPVDPLPEPRESAWDELLEEEALTDQPEDPQSQDPKVEEEVDLDREEAELERKEKEEGQDLEQTDPAVESESGGKQPSTEPVANQKEQPCGKRSGSQEEQQSVDRMESEGEPPETKQRKVDSAEKPKAASQLKDLDFLVPKAGYFCQICSCFCVDEESMKSHCLSQLHQQKMEKFMIKSTAEENEGTEEESLT